MAIVTAGNPELFKSWINYLLGVHRLEYTTPQIRTEAFFNSQRGYPVPWGR